MAFKEFDGRNYLVIENAKILFRNFEGKEKKNNRAGERNFCVKIDDPELAQQLAADGWNIKTLTSRDGEDDDTHFIQVKVGYEKGKPPIIKIKTENTEIYYDEETVKNLDNAELADIKVVITPYHWEVNGKSGIKAYLKTMKATLIDDDFFFDDDADDADLPFDV